MLTHDFREENLRVSASTFSFDGSKMGSAETYWSIHLTLFVQYATSGRISIGMEGKQPKFYQTELREKAFSNNAFHAFIKSHFIFLLFNHMPLSEMKLSIPFQLCCK